MTNFTTTRLVGTYSVADLQRRALRRGAASAFDLRGNTMSQYVIHRSPEHDDIETVRGDWFVIGADMRRAADQVTDGGADGERNAD